MRFWWLLRAGKDHGLKQAPAPQTRARRPICAPPTLLEQDGLNLDLVGVFRTTKVVDQVGRAQQVERAQRLALRRGDTLWRGGLRAWPAAAAQEKGGAFPLPRERPQAVSRADVR